MSVLINWVIVKVKVSQLSGEEGAHGLSKCKSLYHMLKLILKFVFFGGLRPCNLGNFGGLVWNFSSNFLACEYEVPPPSPLPSPFQTIIHVLLEDVGILDKMMNMCIVSV